MPCPTSALSEPLIYWCPGLYYTFYGVSHFLLPSNNNNHNNSNNNSSLICIIIIIIIQFVVVLFDTM